TLPLHHPAAPQEPPFRVEQAHAAPPRVPILVVEDQPEQQHLYERMLRETRYASLPVHTLRQAKEALARSRPAAVVVDVMLGNESAWRWLGELKGAREAAALPVIVVSNVDDPRKGYALGADAYLQKPLSGPVLIEELDRLTQARILIIDDDPAARYT